MNVFTHSDLKKLTGRKLACTPIDGQVRVDNCFVYNVDQVKIRGERGSFVFVDLLDKDNKHLATFRVFMTDELHVYHNQGTSFEVIKSK